MLSRLRFIKRLAVDLPRQVRLAYCLMRDSRVPVRTKVAFGAGIAVIVTPFVDLPAAIPVVGELDMLALSLLALRLFIAACPDDVVADVEQQILEGRSVFDEDLRGGQRIATMIACRFEHSDTPDQQGHDSEPVSPPAKQTGVGA
jgi:uncharacterized membrane protein YkvA (DUF1232 family)